MGWFSGINVNERVSLAEGQTATWRFSLDKTRPVSISVQSTDGHGFNVFIASDAEFRNFQRGLQYRYYLGFDNIERFSNTGNLPRGNYYLVAHLPERHDGVSGFGEALIRCESLD